MKNYVNKIDLDLMPVSKPLEFIVSVEFFKVHFSHFWHERLKIKILFGEKASFLLVYFFVIKIKRTKGLHIFDLDDSVSKSVTTISQYHLTSEGILPVEVRKYGN